MKNELQYKYSIENRSSFIKKLESHKIKLTDPTSHSYTYFEQPIKDDSIFIVLRIKESEGKKAIDMKIRDNKSGHWEKFESKIEDSEQLKRILENLGCKEIFTFNKKRQTFINEFIRLDVDTTKELGTFLEVKFLANNKEKAEQFLSKLGIDVNSYDKRSVVEIYLSKYKKR